MHRWERGLGAAAERTVLTLRPKSGGGQLFIFSAFLLSQTIELSYVIHIFPSKSTFFTTLHYWPPQSGGPVIFFGPPWSQTFQKWGGGGAALAPTGPLGPRSPRPHRCRRPCMYCKRLGRGTQDPEKMYIRSCTVNIHTIYGNCKWNCQ